MTTFIIGIILLLGGGYFYGNYCEKQIRPDDRKTPAVLKEDGVDYIPMKKWKNSLIELLNIAGTGPILGPIQGILFGPIAFILIPIGCVIGGAMHDYMSGMISIRSNGAQMPELIKENLGKKLLMFIMYFFVF
ncbi:MAG: carbon starvation CstA family protein [Clostridium sp.]